MSEETELSQIDNQNASAFSVLLLISMPEVAGRIASSFADEGFSVQRSADIAEAHRILQDQDFDFIICEHLEQGANGLEFLRSLKDNDIRSNVIILADSNSSDSACEALRLGAADYLSFSTSTSDLLFTVRKTRERERFRLENESLRSQVARRYSFSNIIAKSPAMLEIYETIKKIADYKTTILIYGESGTGKELVARAVHHNSIRRHKRFVAINCGAIPENLLESELFGHKRGSFTDALRDKKGLFEEAEGGTILLDEIGELPLHLQVKI
ncbi:MAG TPA: sigma 54-interacting transcriptional regulator, partial [Oligoflexia bacterium]|nr:sigma 54-interacting transcriptional regulator [Oligoflexia bacterium]